MKKKANYESLSDSDLDYIYNHLGESDNILDTSAEICGREDKSKLEISEERKTAKRFAILILILALISLTVGIIKLFK
jgi:hypothetical protein